MKVRILPVSFSKTWRYKLKSGYFGIGIQNIKYSVNYGTLFRTAYSFNADFIFTIGRKCKQQSSDTINSCKHIPTFRYLTFDDFYKNLPFSCILVGVEILDNAQKLQDFTHPKRACYLLGAEDGGLTKEAIECCHVVVVLLGETCLNVATAGSIVMYDRLLKK